MPYGVLHSERKEWRRAKEDIITGIQSGDPAALDALHASYREAVEREAETFFAGSSRRSTTSAYASRPRSRSSPTTASRGASATTTSRRSRARTTCTAPTSTTRSSACRSSLPPRALEPAVVASQVSLVDLMPTLLELADAPIDGLDGSSLLPLAAGRRRATARHSSSAPTRGAVSQVALRQPPWKLTVHIQSGDEEAYRFDVDPGELSSRPDDVPGQLRERLYAELETVSRQTLTAEEQALVEQRLSDLGYL